MKKLIFLISCTVLLAGCGVEVVQNYGVTSVVFPESRQDSIIIKKTILQDSIISSIAVNRTGVSPTYPAINVIISVSKDSLNSVLNLANTAAVPTTDQLWFKGVLVLPDACYQLQTSIIIPENGRTAVLPITLIKTELDKLDKNKKWMIAFKIESAENMVLSKNNNIEFLKISFK